LARAKNIQRSAARRRHREEVRANQLASGVATANEIDDQPAGTVSRSAPQPARPQAPEPRKSLFSRPHVMEDIRALPGIFRTKPLVWLPFGILLAGFLIDVAFARTDPNSQTYAIAGLVYNLVLYPQALFVPFIAGFLAPRASYLVGALVGIFCAVLNAILFTLLGAASVPTGGTSTGLLADPSQFVLLFTIPVILYAFVAGFASWYRNFLRNSQERARQNRLARDEMARQKAKEEERKQRLADREARRTAASRNTTP